MTIQSIQGLLNESDYKKYLELANYYDKKEKKRLKTTEVVIYIIRNLHAHLETKGQLGNE